MGTFEFTAYIADYINIKGIRNVTYIDQFIYSFGIMVQSPRRLRFIVII